MAKVSRLDKYLANSGAGTRSEVKDFIRKGCVTVNGLICKKPEQKIDEEADRVCLNDEIISYTEFEYYMFYKPAGCVTATQDNTHKTVMDYIVSSRKKELFPVGRLDIDTEGLLLITNNGELAHRLLSPAHHVTKAYYARIDGRITEKEIQAFAQGLDIGEARKTMPAILEVISCGETSQVVVKIREGKFHQIKRMFHAVGMEVTYLKRISMGNLKLDETLEKGQYRPLTEEEIALL
ncbi:MAG: pseudouridine synthase [Eubacteriales bacterium]|nr:pseudouridine synthase [Eubacteriales bacterium]